MQLRTRRQVKRECVQTGTLWLIEAIKHFQIPEVMDNYIEDRYVDGEMVIDIASTVVHAAVVAIIVNAKTHHCSGS